MGVLRWIGQALALVVFIICGIGVLSGFWLRQEVVDEDQYLRTVAPLAHHAVIQRAVSTRIMTYLDRVGSGAATTGTQSAGAGAAFTSQYSRFRPQIQVAVGQALASPAFATAWTEANRAVHPALESILTGTDNGAVSATDGLISIDLGPAYASVQSLLNDQGVTLLQDVQPSPQDLQITITDSRRVTDIQRYARLFHRGLWALVAGLVVSGLLVLWLARTLRRGLLALGLGTLVVGVVTLIVIYAGRRIATTNIADPESRLVAVVFYDTILHSLRRLTIVVALAGLALAVLMTIVRAFRGPGPQYVR